MPLPSMIELIVEFDDYAPEVGVYVELERGSRKTIAVYMLIGV